MKRLAVVVMVIVMAIPVFYIGSTFYAAYFFEHDFTPIESEGPAAANELRYWLVQDVRDVTNAHGFRYKSGMPPLPLFFYRFEATPDVVARLTERFGMQERAIPSNPPSGERLPDWWQPPSADADYYVGHDDGNPVFVWHTPQTGVVHLHMRAEG